MSVATKKIKKMTRTAFAETTRNLIVLLQDHDNGALRAAVAAVAALDDVNLSWRVRARQPLCVLDD